MTTASPQSTSPQSGTLRLRVASYDRYADAQRAVDMLSDHKFPVDHVTIVGTDLRLVERVTGRLTVARAALLGAVTGLWIGLLVGLVFVIVSPWTVAPIVTGVLFGLGFGALWGAIAHALTGGRRDFASLQALEAARYDVLVEEAYAEDAVRLLGRRPADTGAPATTDRW
ncbi:MAG TPA: general stress protein [Mycobacteriales bacterium]